jgi:hypothetical protein
MSNKTTKEYFDEILKELKNAHNKGGKPISNIFIKRFKEPTEKNPNKFEALLKIYELIMKKQKNDGTEFFNISKGGPYKQLLQGKIDGKSIQNYGKKNNLKNEWTANMNLLLREKNNQQTVWRRVKFKQYHNAAKKQAVIIIQDANKGPPVVTRVSVNELYDKKRLHQEQVEGVSLSNNATDQRKTPTPSQSSAKTNPSRANNRSRPPPSSSASFVSANNKNNNNNNIASFVSANNKNNNNNNIASFVSANNKNNKNNNKASFVSANNKTPPPSSSSASFVSANSNQRNQRNNKAANSPTPSKVSGAGGLRGVVKTVATAALGAGQAVYGAALGAGQVASQFVLGDELTPSQIAQIQKSRQTRIPSFPEIIQNIGKNRNGDGPFLQNVKGDGSCLYHAILVQYNKNRQIKMSVSQMRQNLAAFCHTEKKQFKSFVVEQKSGNKSYERYCDGIKKKQWGDELEIQMLARMLKQPIGVYQDVRDDQGKPTGDLVRMAEHIPEVFDRPLRPIYLYYVNSNHYQAILNMEQLVPTVIMANRNGRVPYNNNKKKVRFETLPPKTNPQQPVHVVSNQNNVTSGVSGAYQNNQNNKPPSEPMTDIRLEDALWAEFALAAAVDDLKEAHRDYYKRYLKNNNTIFSK